MYNLNSVYCYILFWKQERKLSMRSALNVIKEQIEYFYLIRRLSLYEIKSKNQNNYLGMAWEIINPSIQLVIYWFVFGTIRNRAPVEIGGESVPFFTWLLAGFFIWIFCYQAIIQGSRSIYTRLRMLSKMNFPMSVIPNFVIFSNFYIHIVVLFMSMIIFQFRGYYVTIYYLQFLYFMFAAFCLLFAISLITSTLSTMVRDIHMFLNSILRMLFYVSGVLWPITILNGYPTLMKLMMLNPIYYLIQGYRAAFFGSEWYFVVLWQYTLYLLIVVLILLFVCFSL